MNVIYHTIVGFRPQIRKQMFGSDLHVFTLKFLALKNWFFPHKKHFQNFFWLLITCIQCNVLVRIFKKKLEEFFVHKSLKMGLKSCS